MADFKAIQQLDLNLLKVFESLYLEQNMTRCAEALHITPSAVSHSMKRLRECLQDPLFVRSQNKMLPTPACQRMAPLIIDNLSRLRQILQQWGDFDPALSHHHFRLGLHHALEAAVLPKLAKSLAQLAPHITFASLKVNRRNMLSELAAGHIDMLVDVALPIRTPVRHKALVDDEFCVLMRAQHPLCKNLHQESYFAASHISVSNRPVGPAAEDILFQERGLMRHLSVRCQNYYAAKAVLIDSDLLLTLPRQLASQLLDADLTIAAMPITMPTISTHLYWHENTEHDAALAWFRQIVAGLFIGPEVVN
jgi:DNA-binding transcriptional LysR family regulator